METDARPVRGRAGEAMARLFLETRGYRTLAERVRVGRQELDLVVERGELLVAVEVKWRRVAAASGPGEDARAAAPWSAAQRARAHAAVLALMGELPRGTERPWRLDLVVIEEGPRGFVLTHHAGAWSPGGSFW
jgi:putative endonuclease